MSAPAAFALSGPALNQSAARAQYGPPVAPPVAPPQPGPAPQSLGPAPQSLGPAPQTLGPAPESPGPAQEVLPSDESGGSDSTDDQAPAGSGVLNNRGDSEDRSDSEDRIESGAEAPAVANGSLPFTGGPVGGILGAGVLLLVGGLLLRRRAAAR